jgi:hypothetical protein
VVPVTNFLLGSNILIDALFRNTPNLWSI